MKASEMRPLFGEGELMRLATFLKPLAIAVAACLCLPPARADVITGPPQGYTDSEEFGEEVDYWTAYRTPNGIPYRASLGPGYGVTGHGVEWNPVDLPVFVALGRDGKGHWLLMSSLIRDRDGKYACWSFAPVAGRGAKPSAALERLIGDRLKIWTAQCPAARTFGADAILGGFRSARPDLRKALRRMDANRLTRFLDEERTVGVGSFHPEEVRQSLLDAIADTCAVPRATLTRRNDGTIALAPAKSSAPSAEADSKAEYCVTEQIRYLPGVREPG